MLEQQDIDKILKQHISKEFDFIGVGQAKCGTTALWYYLLQHPDVFAGPPHDIRDHEPFPLYKWLGKNNSTPWVGLEMKEPNFFNIDTKRYDVTERFKIKKHKTWIDSINTFHLPGQMLSEFTVHYMDEKETLRRIKAHSPNVKILGILRDPINRLYSHINWTNNPKSIEEWEQKINYMMNRPIYELIIQKSIYSDKVENCLEIFGRENVKFIKYEDFRDNNERVIYEVLDFLGLDKQKYTFNQEFVLLKPWVTPIPSKLQNHFYDIFYPEIEKIQNLLGWNCSDWYK